MKRRDWLSCVVMLILIFIAINLFSLHWFGSGHRYTSIGVTEWLRLRQNFITPTEVTVTYPRLGIEILIAMVLTFAWACVKRRKGSRSDNVH